MKPVGSLSSDRGKRAFDLLVGGLLFVVSLPIAAVVGVEVRRRLGTPVLFRQQRPGRHGQLFTLYKFRTMTDDRDASGQLLPDGDRLPPFGRWLRATSLDELPELWNILRGDMGLVGPRPLLPDYLPHYTPEQARRHDVRPGLTGWAQVNGRNDLPWHDRLRMDVWYVDHRSLRLDLVILWRTMTAVLRGRSITASGHATAPRFDRSDER